MTGLIGALSMLKSLFTRKTPEILLDELQALRRVIHAPGDQAAREAFHVPPGSPIRDDNDFNRRIVSTEMQQKLESTPTTAFYRPDNSLAGAYQLDPGKWGTELSYLLSNEPGLGKQLLEEAYRSAKQLQPDKRVVLNAIPGSEGFYRKQIPLGWTEGVREGTPIFIRKAKGGLAQFRGK